MIHTKDIEARMPLLNVTELARLAGMEPRNLHAKITRGSELKVNQAEALEAALAAAGIRLTQKKSSVPA